MLKIQPIFTCASFIVTLPLQYLQATMKKRKLASVLEMMWVSRKWCTHAGYTHSWAVTVGWRTLESSPSHTDPPSHGGRLPVHGAPAQPLTKHWLSNKLFMQKVTPRQPGLQIISQARPVVWKTVHSPKLVLSRATRGELQAKGGQN